MSVTQIRRNTQIKAGTAHRVVVNDASGLLADAAAITAARALISDANGIPTHSAVTSTELGHVSGVTSAIQTQLDGKASTALNNLAAVAINTSLVSDTDATDDLGSSTIGWNRLYLADAIYAGATELATTTELGYLDGVTSNIQTQLNGKLNLSGGTMTGFLTLNADPTNALHAATKQYVDSVAAGLDPKASSRLATTPAGGNIPGYSAGTITVPNANATYFPAAGAMRVDGVAVAVGNRILVKNQTNAVQNGIYSVTVAGSQGSTDAVLVRSTDMDGTPTNEVSSGNFTFVEVGTVNTSTGWVVDGDGILTLDTDTIDWVQFSSAGVFSFNDTNSIDMTTTGTVITADLRVDSATDGYATLSVSGSGTRVVSIKDTNIASDAAIAFSKLAALTSANILVGNGSNVATSVSVSGDVTLSNAGVVAITSTALSGSGHFVTRETPTGDVNGSNLVFDLANTPISGTEHVYKNGILQNAGSGNDYQISGDTITFETGNAPQTGDVLLVSYHK